VAAAGVLKKFKNTKNNIITTEKSEKIKGILLPYWTFQQFNNAM
jgi:hypothetical protein